MKHENDIPAQCGARKNSWKKKPTLSPDAVMQLAPPAGESFVKKIFAKNMRETLGASVRDADAALAGLISQGKLIEKALPGPSGQKQLHISRPAAG